MSSKASETVLLGSARDAAYWLAAASIRVVDAARTSGFASNLNQLVKRMPEYETAIVAALDLIPATSAEPPDFGGSAGDTTYHQAVLSFGRRLSWQLDCCRASEMLMTDRKSHPAPNELCRPKVVFKPVPLEDNATDEPAPVDESVTMANDPQLALRNDARFDGLREQLVDVSLPSICMIDFWLRREHDSAILALKTGESPCLDGPVPPDGFRWNGRTVSGFSASQFAFMTAVWFGKDKSTDLDQIAIDMRCDHTRPITLDAAKQYANKINKRLGDQTPWRIQVNKMGVGRATFIQRPCGSEKK